MKRTLAFIAGIAIALLIGYDNNQQEALGAPAAELIYQKNLIPITSNSYYVGTTSSVWKGGHFNELCLSGSCISSWLAGGGGGGTTLYVQNGGATLNTGTTTLNFTSNSFSLTENPTDTFTIRVSTTTLGLLASSISDFVSTVRTSISETITGIGYDSGTGVLSLDSGYTIPTTTRANNWDTAFSWGNHASAGYDQVTTAGDGLTRTLNDFDCDTGSGSVFGCITAADWVTFNSKVSSTSIDTSNELLALLDDETGTAGSLVFSGNPLLQGFRSNASSTIGDGTGAGGLTIAGNSTTTGNAYFAGNVGIGTIAPTQKLEVAGNIFMNTGYLMQTDTWGMKWKFAGDSDTVEMNSSETAWKFNIAGGGVTKYRFNSSKTGFGPILDLNTSGSSIFYGNVGIGSSSPSRRLTVSGDIYSTGNLTAASSTLGNATSTSLAITGISGSTQCLRVNSSGVVSGTGSDCASGADGMSNWSLVNGALTPTTTTATYGIRVNASSTIGGGTAVTGLTISGGATTTGNHLIMGSATSTTSFFSALGTFTNSVVNTLLTAAAATFTGLVDIGAGVLEIPNGTGPTVDSIGELALDSTSNQLVLYGTEKKVIGNGNIYSSFTYATSTAWTGTTTIPLGTARVAETWNDIQCFTDAGTLNVSIYDGTNRMNANAASTTVGTTAFSTNNTFTAGEKRYVDVGTPASSPTKISCTVSKSLTSD